jgi:drug/metabolite transporter (DMT)-like permease
VLGLFEVSLAMVFAGSSVVVGKLLATRIPVFLSAELSLCAALLAILPLQIARRRELARVDRRQIGSMLLQALFGIVLFRVLTLTGLRHTSAVHAGIITAAAPAVTALLAVLLLRERLRVPAVAGIVLTVAGLVVVNLRRAPEGSGGLQIGNLMVGAAVACEALLTILRRSSGGRVGAVTNATILIAASALMLMPFAINDVRHFPLREIDPVGWLSVGYYGAVATVIAYILWGDGAVRIPANRSGIAMAAMPVSSLALSALVLGEPVGWLQLAGCVVVMGGIVLGGLRAAA